MAANISFCFIVKFLINLFLTNVLFTEKPGKWFTLAKCLEGHLDEGHFIRSSRPMTCNFAKIGTHALIFYKNFPNKCDWFLHKETSQMVCSESFSYEKLHSLIKCLYKQVSFKHFCLQPFLLKDSVSLVFAQLSGSMAWAHGRHRRKHVSNLGLQIVRKCIFLQFFWEFH